MKYPDHEREWYAVSFKTKSNPNKWRTGMFYWNGKQPVFASYGTRILDVIEWKYKKKY